MINRMANSTRGNRCVRVARSLHAAIGFALSLGAPAPALAGEAYSLSVNTPASSVSYTFNLSAPFSGTLVGENDPAKPLAQQTRSKRAQSLFSCGTFGATQNDPITISGTVSSTGASPTPTNIRPAGSLTIGFDATAGTAFARGLNLQLVSTGAISIVANLANFNYQSFCTVNPSCLAPFLFTPPPLEVGSINVTSISLVQPAGNAIGTLTPAGADAFQVSIPLVVTATLSATFSGAPFPAEPQSIPLVLGGTITRSGGGATFTSTLTLDLAPPGATMQTPLPPFPTSLPSTSPICAGTNLILALTLNSLTLISNTTTVLNAGGPRIACPCDFNGGGISVQDVFDFLGAWFANDPRANFNADASITVQDVFDFLNCWFSPPPEC